MLRPRLKIWLETASGEVALSDWRVELLRAIEQYGSLAEAARQLRVPYKTAWYKLKEMEANLGLPLLVTSSGGAEGGHTHITPAAKQAIARYEAITEGLDDEIERRFEQAFADNSPS